MTSDYLHCQRCGKTVSTGFRPDKTDTPDGGLIVRAWIECPECIEKQSAGRMPPTQYAEEYVSHIPDHTIAEQITQHLESNTSSRVLTMVVVPVSYVAYPKLEPVERHHVIVLYEVLPETEIRLTEES